MSENKRIKDKKNSRRLKASQRGLYPSIQRNYGKLTPKSPQMKLI
jgi:hypothetical protein